MNIFVSLSIMFFLFNSFVVTFGNEINLIKFADPSYKFNFSYPDEWKIQYQNNNDIFFFPANITKYNNTFVEIGRDLLYNLSLKDHVFRDLNYYISKYLIGDFVSFRINNIESNLTINKSPAYKIEYHVIMNDKFKSPVTLVEFYTTDKKDSLYKLKFKEDGYNTNLANENSTKLIINSFSFNPSNIIH
jgi:hypothetical protein